MCIFQIIRVCWDPAKPVWLCRVSTLERRADRGSVGVFVRCNLEYLIERAIANDGRCQRNQSDNSDKILKNNAIDQHDCAEKRTYGTIFLPHIFRHGCSVKVNDRDWTFWQATSNNPLQPCTPAAGMILESAWGLLLYYIAVTQIYKKIVNKNDIGIPLLFTDSQKVTN